MNSACLIRPFQYPRDYAAILKLWESTETGLRVGRSDAPAEIEKKLKRDPDLFLVAEAGNEIIGTVMGAYDGRRGTIYHLAVSAAFRKQGLGARLMEEVESRLRAKGCIRCYLMVMLDNDDAARFYEKRGWGLMDHVRPYAKDLI